MHEHMAYLLVLRLTGIYNSKHPNNHPSIVDAEGIGDKLEVCVVFFDNLYNCVLANKLFIEVEPDKPQPPLECPLHLGSPPLYSSA
jgi:hypothetical protein